MGLDLSRLPIHFSEIMTADGSPTLSFSAGTGNSEAMHHSGGALSETRQIYGPVLKSCFERPSSPGSKAILIVSLGTGLAYNEILAAKTALQYPDRKFHLYTYESDEFLRASFACWLQGEKNLALRPIYEQICQGFEVTTDQVRKLYTDENSQAVLIVQDRLSNPDQLPTGVNGFLWDAFSKKTSPELWDEEFLVACFAKADPGFCELGTYARNGNLKRSLERAGFHVIKEKGFGSKQSSTRAFLKDV